MILDLSRFVATERPYWNELQEMLDQRRDMPTAKLDVPRIERLHYLYERCSTDLTHLDPFSDPQVHRFLEALVARAYSEIHEDRGGSHRIPWRDWLRAFPRAFRRRLAAFLLSALITLGGCAFGLTAILTDPEAKATIMPFPGLMQSPSQRVAQEEKGAGRHLQGTQARFSAQLMTNNIRVTLMALALGLTWGIGTILVLFYNGVILGAVVADYLMDGQAVFLLGWLLPHGSVEIPCILIGGQAGLSLAGALIGWGERRTRSDRLREVAPDLVALAAGAAFLLVWAGLVEAFVSQYHRPVLPYSAKIAFGLVESAALWFYLFRVGRP